MSDQISLCDSIEPLLGDYADGEVVSASEKARIEAHLKICPGCASEIAFLRATNFVVSSRFPDVQPPADLFVRTALATYNRPTLRARLAGWFAPMPVRLGVGSAVAAAVVVAVVLPISRSHFESVTDSQVASNEPASGRAVPDKGGQGATAPAKSTVATSVQKTSSERHELAVATAKNAAASTAPELHKVGAEATPEKVLVSAATRIASGNNPTALTHDIPTIIKRVKLAPLVIPAMRETELSRRGGDFQRTLANGDLPKEFAVTKVGVPIEEAPAPARIATLTSPSATEVATSSAHSVVEPPPAPRGLHISLGSAGGRVAFAPIQGIKSHDTSNDSLLPGDFNLPMDEKTDTDNSAKNVSHGKIP